MTTAHMDVWEEEKMDAGKQDWNLNNNKMVNFKTSVKNCGCKQTAHNSFPNPLLQLSDGKITSSTSLKKLPLSRHYTKQLRMETHDDLNL